MNAFRACPLLLAAGLAAGMSPVEAQQAADASVAMKIESALSAAPPAVAAAAAVMDLDEHLLRPGTNGWTCFPASGSGDTPICLDEQWRKWFKALRKRETPAVTQVGIAFELQGGSAASNARPGPAPGGTPVRYGPAITILVPDPSALKDLPTDPYSGGPFVMWQGTPYAHLHIPLKTQVEASQ